MGISSVCIVCLNKDITNPKSIQQEYKDGEKLSSIYLKCTGINIKKRHPDHTQLICDLCEKKLLDVYLFKKHCINSDGIINYFLQNQSSLMEMELSEEPNLEAVEYKKSYAQSEDSDDEKDIEKLQDVGKPIVYQCKRCLAKFGSVKSLMKHIQTHKKFPSQFCSTKFRKQTDVYRHQHNYHEDENKYMCFISKERFLTYQQLRAHIAKWHKIEEQICTKPYKHIPRPFKKCPKTIKRKCYDCKKEFTCLNELYWHAKCAHPCPKPPPELPIIEDEPPESHQCEYCGKCFTKIELFDIHKLCHPEYLEEGETLSKKAVTGLYHCLTCDLKMYQMGLYEAHMDTFHTNEYLCGDCKKFFKDFEKLRQHRREHFKIDNNICRICDKRFLNDKQLKKHFKKSHPGLGIKPKRVVYYKRSTFIQLLKMN